MHPPRRLPCLLLAALAGTLAFAPPASAGTYLLNSDFRETLSGWTPIGEGAVQWSTTDVEDSPWSGTALLHNAEPVAGRVRTLRQCVPLTYPGHYRLRAAGRLVSGQEDAALAVSYMMRVSPDCSGAWFGGGGAFFHRNDGWEFADIVFNVSIVPVTVEIELALDKYVDGGNASGWFDDVYFDITPLLMRDGFE